MPFFRCTHVATAARSYPICLGELQIVLGHLKGAVKGEALRTVLFAS